MKKTLALYLLLLYLSPCQIAAAQIGQGLTGESIAESAAKVAQQMNRTGRCYEGVCRAMRPLGVDLWGEAAYEANGLLLKDARFVPLVINDTSQLKRGDIIVYNKSAQHPFGHIAVYEGDLIEASDHISAVTHTKNYGGATVFRLSSELQGEYIANANYQTLSPALMQNASYAGPSHYRSAASPNLTRQTLPPLAPDYSKSASSSYTAARGSTINSQRLLKGAQRKLIRRFIDCLLR